MDRKEDKRRKARAQRAARAGERKLEAKIAQLEKDLGLEKAWRDRAEIRAAEAEKKIRAVVVNEQRTSDADVAALVAIAMLESTRVTKRRARVLERLYEELRYRGILPEV